MLVLIPQPKTVALGSGTLRLPAAGTVGVGDQALYAVGCQARDVIDGVTVGIAMPEVADTVRITVNPALRPGGYTLDITAAGVALAAADAAGAFYGVQTLAQVAQQSPAGELPALHIDDWPDFADRAVYYDVCRGRVPTLERLMELADLLAHYKINQLQLYIEHTFRFRRHPDIGAHASPLTAEDIMALDAFCRARHVELVPSLSSFGHLSTVLHLPQYRHLAEDWGEGRYLDPEAQQQHWGGHAWSLAPANEESYVFLRQLFDEFLPCFSSLRFNVCCDENYDLGWGQSYAMAQQMGKGRLYLYHITRLRELAAAHGKRIMIWGDIIRHYPELIPEIPSDVTVLDWGYGAREHFDRIKDFTDTGLPSYACPSVCGYVTLFPRLHEAAENIAGWARAGRQFGIQGILNTDWGDGGHYNFMECAWPGYLYGAEQSWNVDADRPSFWARFAQSFLGLDAPEVAQAIVDLGDVAQTAVSGYYQSAWRHVFFACPGEDILRPVERDASVSEHGVLRDTRLTLTAATGRETAAKLAGIREVFARHADAYGADPHAVLPYWFFAIDTLLHAANKLAVLGEGGDDTPEQRAALKTELTALLRRFEELWLSRNRIAEIRYTLDAYQRAINGLAATA